MLYSVERESLIKKRIIYDRVFARTVRNVDLCVCVLFESIKNVITIFRGL